MRTVEQLRCFRVRLEQQREALRAETAGARRQIAELDTIVAVVRDQGHDRNMLFIHEEAIGELARLEQTLAHIKRALRRLEANSSGASKVLGQPIPIERREALPNATTLVETPLVRMTGLPT